MQNGRTGRARAAARFTIAAFCAIASAGLRCHGEAPVVRPDNGKIAALIGPCPTQLTFPRNLPSIEFRFDDSLSMAGYVTMPSAYRRVVRRIAEGTVQTGYQRTLRRFSDGAPQPFDSLVALLSPGYYRGGNSRVAAVLDDITATRSASRRGEHIVVLVSDLVQSEESRDALSIAASLRALSQEYPFVALYGFRSAFHGTYYVESPPRGRIRLDTEDGVGRPFYVLVMTTSLPALRQFQRLSGLTELAHDNTMAPRVFEPSIPPVEVTGLEMQIDPAERTWIGEEPTQVTVCANGTYRQFVALRKSASAPLGSTFELPFNLTGKARLPLIMIDRYEPRIDRVKPAVDGLHPMPDASARIDPTAAPPAAKITYRFPSPRPREWNTYVVRIRAGDANVQPPQWIAEWSTDDDSSWNARGQTLNLTTFGSALSRALTDQTPFVEHILKFYSEE